MANKPDFDIPEPTEEEIEKTIQKVQDKEKVTLSKDDAILYTKLYEELKQWFLMEENIESTDSIAEETAEHIKERLEHNYKLEISKDQAQEIADESLDKVISREKERIGKELKAITARYK